MGWALGAYMAEQPLIERFNLRSRLRFNVETGQIWLDENRMLLMHAGVRRLTPN
jgi:hypothetical protein